MITSNDIANLIEYIDYNLPTDGPIILAPNELDKPSDIYYQYMLKVAAYINQDTLCLCGLPLQDKIELHHALITKADARGLDNNFIHHSYNVIAIHNHCHQRVTRKQSFEFLCKIYGNLNVKKWYDEANNKLKVRLRNLE